MKLSECLGVINPHDCGCGVPGDDSTGITVRPCLCHLNIGYVGYLFLAGLCVAGGGGRTKAFPFPMPPMMGASKALAGVVPVCLKEDTGLTVRCLSLRHWWTGELPQELSLACHAGCW